MALALYIFLVIHALCTADMVRSLQLVDVRPYAEEEEEVYALVIMWSMRYSVIPDKVYFDFQRSFDKVQHTAADTRPTFVGQYVLASTCWPTFVSHATTLLDNSMAEMVESADDAIGAAYRLWLVSVNFAASDNCDTRSLTCHIDMDSSHKETYKLDYHVFRPFCHHDAANHMICRLLANKERTSS